MSPLKVNLTLTAKEFDFLTNLSAGKKKTLYKMIQAEITKALYGISVNDSKICVGKSKRFNMQLDLPADTSRVIVCVSKKMGMKPGQLIYRMIVAPHLKEIIKKESLVADDAPFVA